MYYVVDGYKSKNKNIMLRIQYLPIIWLFMHQIHMYKYSYAGKSHWTINSWQSEIMSGNFDVKINSLQNKCSLWGDIIYDYYFAECKDNTSLMGYIFILSVG